MRAVMRIMAKGLSSVSSATAFVCCGPVLVRSVLTRPGSHANPRRPVVTVGIESFCPGLCKGQTQSIETDERADSTALSCQSVSRRRQSLGRIRRFSDDKLSLLRQPVRRWGGINEVRERQGWKALPEPIQTISRKLLGPEAVQKAVKGSEAG
jgi:hypothetical protein